jgi:hypothetical protein
MNAPKDERTRRRKRPRTRTEGDSTPAARVESTAPRPKTSPQVDAKTLVLGAAVIAASGAYIVNALGDEARPYSMLAIGTSAFLLGAASSLPERAVVIAGALVVALGLAMVGIQFSEVGVALCLAGGLTLAGGIHRLGRLGPEGATDSFTPGPTWSRSAPTMNRPTRKLNHLEQKVAAKSERSATTKTGAKRVGKKLKRWKKSVAAYKPLVSE